MSPACEAFRHAIHDPRTAADSIGGGHAGACPDCADYLARVVRGVGALSKLSRLPAPAELEGCVVAALQAGARQERAVRAFGSIARLEAPEDVDGGAEVEAELAARLPRLTRPARLSAPDELERLVAAELADPAAFRVRRHVGGLGRLEAPTELDRAVAERLAAGRAFRSTGPAPDPEPPTTLPTQEPSRPRELPAHGAAAHESGPEARPSLPRAWRGFAAAAAVLLLFGLFGPLRRPAPGADRELAERAPAGTPRPRLRLVAARAADLDPRALQLLDGLGGGILSARGVSDGTGGPDGGRGTGGGGDAR